MVKEENKSMKSIIKTKTFWVGLAGIMGGIGAFMAGEITLATLIETEVVAFGIMTLRHTLKKLE